MSDERREVHEAANIFPRLSMDDLAELADDIEANGLHEPIELLDGKIIDGRNREIACRIAGVEPEYIDVKITDPVAYVMSKNLHRRHLTTAGFLTVGAVAGTMRPEVVPLVGGHDDGEKDGAWSPACISRQSV